MLMIETQNMSELVEDNAPVLVGIFGTLSDPTKVHGVPSIPGGESSVGSKS